MKKLVWCIGAVGLLAVSLSVLAAQTASPNDDCFPYKVSDLRLVDRGDRGWQLTWRSAIMMQFDTKADADTILEVFKAHSTFCYVGRNNQRADRMNYVYHYWK